MILGMGGIFAPLFGWFFKLVGEEARAEIKRKKAARKKAKAAAKAKAKREKLERKLAKEKEVERLRQEKSRRVQADLQKQIDGLCDPVAEPGVYGSEQ